MEWYLVARVHDSPKYESDNKKNNFYKGLHSLHTA